VRKESEMGAFQPLHLALIALAALLVFGPKKLPELARGVGESMKELKRSLHGAADSEPAAAREISSTLQGARQSLDPVWPPPASPAAPAGGDAPLREGSVAPGV
jgi:sec-independent protein translocase protein TatA